MILRRLGRQPVKAMLSVLGIALSVAVFVVGNFSADAVDYLMDFQFHGVQRQDLSVAFVEPAAARALADLRHLSGVVRCEPFRSVSVRLRSGHRTRRVAILGLEPDGRLYRPLDSSWRAVRPPDHGLMLSSKLAELLDVRRGDVVIVEVLEAGRPVRRVSIASLVSDYEGTSAYMGRRALNRLLREGGTISGDFLSIDAAHADALYRQLKDAPRVASVAMKQAMLESFRKIIAESLQKMQSFVVAFAAIIAFGVVYNGAHIALAEGSRELATLRVIGFTRAEVSRILLGELAILTLVALPVGLAIGTGFAALTTLFYDTELFRIPMVIYPSTFALAALVTVLSAIASGWIVRRQVDDLDLIAVLKTKE
jgi:putative ABC transport system permease protein